MKKLVIDSETTGLSPTTNQLLTLGMVLVDVSKSRLKFLQEKHLFIRHDEYNTNPFAMAINKINLKEHNKIGIEVPDAIDEIHEFLDEENLFNTPVVGHNFGFDKRFLTTMFENEKQEYPFCSTEHDTKTIWNDLKRQGKIPEYKDGKLKTLAGHFGIDYSKAHNALDDCKITAKVFQGLMNVR